MRANPCPRLSCVGSLWRDENGDRVCSLCGRYPDPISALPLVRKEWVWAKSKRGRPPKQVPAATLERLALSGLALG